MRLIDGDALEKFLSDAEVEATKRKKYVLAGALNVIQGNVRNFPTIEPESKWIPCSERLPSDSDYYLVTDAYGDMSAIWFAHEKDYYGESEWRETEDEILAWMPLPAAYKPEEESE